MEWMYMTASKARLSLCIYVSSEWCCCSGSNLLPKWWRAWQRTVLWPESPSLQLMLLDSSTTVMVIHDSYYFLRSSTGFGTRCLRYRERLSTSGDSMIIWRKSRIACPVPSWFTHICLCFIMVVNTGRLGSGSQDGKSHRPTCGVSSTSSKRKSTHWGSSSTITIIA